MKNIFQPTKCLTIEQIEGYLKEKSSEEERYQIENHLIDCELCTDALEGYANHFNVEEAILPLEEFKLTLDKSPIQKEAEVKTLPVRRFRFSQIAATLLMLVVSTAVFMYWQANENDYSQYHYLAGDELIGFLRTGTLSSSENPNILKGVTYFDLKDYDKSLHFFEEELSENPEDPLATFLAGKAALKSGDLDKAENYMTLCRFNHQQFYEESTWHLIILNLQTGKEKVAKELLSDLEKLEGGVFEEEVKKLKKKLGN